MRDAHYTATLVRLLEEGVHELARQDAPGFREPPEKVARRMLATVPRAHDYDELVGPFYGVEALRTLLGSSRQAIHDRVTRGTLLQVRTSDGVNLYPTFQFDEAGEVPAPVRRAIQALRRSGADGWTIAAWFSTPAQALGGLSPRDWLLDTERDARTLLSLAEQTAALWAAP